MLHFYVIDAFTDHSYSGNPAAVVLVRKPHVLSPEAMQSIAQEFNLSDTAFVTPNEDGSFSLRWFTPTCEVAICGHATLAAAQALLEWKLWRGDAPVRFNTRESGTLCCERHQQSLRLIFPAIPAQKVTVEASMQATFGDSIEGAYRSKHSLMLLLSSAQSVKRAEPRLDQLANLHPRGVIITAEGTAQAAQERRVDFVSRFFAPNCGIPEDPVCGSAHCVLMPFWSKRLGRRSLEAQQLSKRGGRLRLELLVNEGRTKVLVGGDTAITFKGELTPPRQ